MKQLLQCWGNWMVVALNERAFLVQIDSERTLELLPSSETAGSAANNDKSANPIQAVALANDSSGTIWCAVTTLRKSLFLYRVNPSSAFESSTQTPTTTHTTVKRVGCVSFGRVPNTPSTENDNHETPSSEQGILVCCTGGLTGDAWAFSLDEPGKKRLLLGHTASMLTGIKVKGNTILTSDRDEKIRVSSFPDTIIINGFLFGHEAYISALDIASSLENPVCVSCSGGDGTIRIWNHDTMQLLDTWRSETKGEEHDPVPSRVAMDSDGTLVAVIYDQSNVMDILRVESSDNSGNSKSLKRVQSIDCSGQPLAVDFSNGNIVVLQQETTYIQAYSLNAGSSSWEPIELAGSKALQSIAAEANITMLDSVLEKDKHGQATMAKISETRGGASKPLDQMPWNRSERIDIAKERTKRHKRRRAQQRKGGE